jgi:hypothetical protein
MVLSKEGMYGGKDKKSPKTGGKIPRKKRCVGFIAYLTLIVVSEGK